MPKRAFKVLDWLNGICIQSDNSRRTRCYHYFWCLWVGVQQQWFFNWRTLEAKEHINLLEILAILIALKSLLTLTHGKHDTVVVDNSRERDILFLPSNPQEPRWGKGLSATATKVMEQSCMLGARRQYATAYLRSDGGATAVQGTLIPFVSR